MDSAAAGEAASEAGNRVVASAADHGENSGEDQGLPQPLRTRIPPVLTKSALSVKHPRATTHRGVAASRPPAAAVSGENWSPGPARQELLLRNPPVGQNTPVRRRPPHLPPSGTARPDGQKPAPPAAHSPQPNGQRRYGLCCHEPARQETRSSPAPCGSLQSC